MSQRKQMQYEKYYRIALSALSSLLVGGALWQVASRPLRWESVMIAAFSLILSRLTFTRTASSTAVTISEAFLYLTLLLSGLSDAILVAALLTCSEALQYAKGRVLVVAFNVAATCCSVAGSAWLVEWAFGSFHSLQFNRKTFFVYLLALACLAASQWGINMIFMLTSLALRPNKTLWLLWVKDNMWGVITPLAGILVASIVNALVYYYGFVALFSLLPLLAAVHAISYPYVKNIKDARRHAEEINALHERTLEAFITAVDSKKRGASRRVERMQVYGEGLAKLLNLSAPEIKALQAAALLHDIGSIAVPDYILNKPGKLSIAEHEKMQLHTIVGAQILEQIELPYPLAPVVRHHHERWDGTGYPDKLAQEAIPLTARVMAVLDGYESRCEDRQYRKAMTREQALESLRTERGKAYDPGIVDLLLAHAMEFEEQLAQLDRGRQATQVTEAAEKTYAVQPLTAVAEEKAAAAGFAQAIHESRQLMQGSYALFEIAAQLAGVLDVTQAMNIFTSLLDSVIPFNAEADTCVLYWLDDEQRQARVEFVTGMQSEKFVGLHIKPGEGVTGWTLANQSLFANTDPALDIFALELSRREGAGLSGYQTVAVFPVLKNEELLGALTLYSKTLKSFDNEQLSRLQRATALLSDVLSGAKKYDRAQRQALCDAVTELPNARYLHTHFAEEAARSPLFPLALILADVSGFRQMTEKAENQRTDVVVQEIAALLQAQLRKSDTLVHYLGDQFVVLLHNVSSETAAQISARLQSAVIEARSFLLSVDDAVFGLSLGQARLGEDGATIEELLNTAQLRLQADKAARHSFTDSLAA
ncbi:MAG: diguanylate cyclase [Blastocatellia bacterium]